MNNFYNLLGFAGVVLIVYCYARLQWHRDFAKHFQYSFCNFLGAVFVAISLLHDSNLAAFAVNVIMASISAYGIFRCAKYHFKNRGQKPQPETPREQAE